MHKKLKTLDISDTLPYGRMVAGIGPQIHRFFFFLCTTVFGEVVDENKKLLCVTAFCEMLLSFFELLVDCRIL